MKHKLIAVSEENYQILRKLGNLGDTYNDVISALLKRNKPTEERKTSETMTI